MAISDKDKEALIKDIMDDVGVDDVISVSKDDIVDTISSILRDYNLSPDMSFIEKLSNIKFDDKTKAIDISTLPTDLKDAAFLPVNTIADIALRQDLDLLMSQIPEWYTAIQLTRDAICEADLADGRISRTISIDRNNITAEDKDNVISKVENVEDSLKLHSEIKNHAVFEALHYGESYIYNVPYAKVFEDLYKYKMSGDKEKSSMFSASSALSGYGYGESAIEISLKDTIINDSTTSVKFNKKSKNKLFTEAEIMEINPSYHKTIKAGDTSVDMKTQKENDDMYDSMIDYVSSNIKYIEDDIALPVIEHSGHDLKVLYETKYKDKPKYIQEAKTFFEAVMNESSNDYNSIGNEFKNIQGIYLRVLPGTKLIPLRIDKTVIGYYYISDLTRPEQSGQRRNNGLSGYTMNSPSLSYDTFSPDIMFCEKLATKIINNFNLKFMRDNVSLHKQIVAILQSHKFNESMMRFVFIPAEHVTRFSVNEDGLGKGHSMLEPGIVNARLYMFLKLYSVLYQVNNSQIRVYNLRTSGIDKNYKQFVQEAVRKLTARRINSSDIFNYQKSISKINGGSELVMMLGSSDKAPLTVDTIPAAETPISNELLDALKQEAIGTPVPSLLVNTGMSEMEFAKEAELANTRFNTMVNSYKIDLNLSITSFYRRIMRWETDIDPEILYTLKFSFNKPAAKELNVTAEMVNNFNAICELAIPIFLKSSEIKGTDEGQEQSEIVREFKKLLLEEYIHQISIERFEELADIARNNANITKLKETNSQENIVNNGLPDDGGEMM